jgi:hypothetical protein
MHFPCTRGGGFFGRRPSAIFPGVASEVFEKYGYKPARETIQTDSVSDELRNSLWSILKMEVWDHVYHSPSYGGAYITNGQNPDMSRLCSALWFSYFKRPLDTLGTDWGDIREELRQYFFSCKWYEVYDFIQYIAQNFPYRRTDTDQNRFIRACNSVFERELSAYRFVGSEITRLRMLVRLNLLIKHWRSQQVPSGHISIEH